ncbi:MAG TPA: polyphosphate kinase 1 [Chiayiivirga sp.]|nr:polyphosphate kinase 1 [Chiayiivirga sp.]
MPRRKPRTGRLPHEPAHTRVLDDPSLYLNRELSQLEFNFRVLAQALDPDIPLLERVRFLCISCTNLDEFFEIRVAGVHQVLDLGLPLPSDGTAPQALLKLIHERASTLVDEQYRAWREVLRPALADAGVRILSPENWDERQRQWLRQHFVESILPVLSPLGLDPAHPFPRILNKSLNVVVVLHGKDAFGRAGKMAVVRAPRSLPRIIQLPIEVSGGSCDFVLLSTVLSSFVDELFPGMHVKGAYQFRVTRNAELAVDEDEVENLAHAVKDELRGRGFARAMRLEIADNCPKSVIAILLEKFELAPEAAYRINGPVNLNRVIAIHELVDRPDLKFPPLLPRKQPDVEDERLFETIRAGDVLLHHPFDSFAAVIALIRLAGRDPDVLAIKQTLYRAGQDSVLVEHLIEAARNGKDVTVVIELRARFDEEANLRLADRLQEAGVQVTYGVVGFKTHAKMLLIVRREGGRLQRYAHLSTGNYHAGTARLYTDIGLMTAHPEIGEDVHRMFQQLSGLAPSFSLARVLQSPFTLHAGVLTRIEREAEHARTGRPARIIAKMNALNERGVMQALYRASQAGVEIDLIVRGACSLRPGVAGISDRIRVRSIVGRLLEHSRVYWFGNDGQPELYCSSADWLERNLLRRIEVSFPILDPVVAQRVFDEVLANYLADTQQAWELHADGSYSRILPEAGQPAHNAQQQLIERLCH